LIRFVDHETKLIVDIVRRRPIDVTLLAVFFLLAAIISVASFASLVWPGPLDFIWRINPKAHQAFVAMGRSAIVLLAIVGVACALSFVGLWRCRRWGHRLAIAVFTINLAGDIANAFATHDLRAAVGVPIVLVFLVDVLSPRVRRFFAADA